MTNTNYIHRSSYFYGNKISEYGLECGRVDYATLAKSFDAILNNGIMQATEAAGMYWELENGSEYYFEDENGNILSCEEYDDLETEEQEKCSECWSDIYQYYIISDNGARILSELTDEIVWYCEKLDMYVWGVCHYGTSWDYVLTNIKIEK